MLSLELLYIPISTQAVPLVFAKQTGCDAGEYLSYERAGKDALFPFVNHTAVCEMLSTRDAQRLVREAWSFGCSNTQIFCWSGKTR